MPGHACAGEIARPSRVYSHCLQRRRRTSGGDGWCRRKKLTRAARQQGKVNEGTFGVVFKAIKASEKSNYEYSVAQGQVYPSYFAIKKPKNNAREGEGFNKDAVREIALLMELKRGTGVKVASLDSLPSAFVATRMSCLQGL